MSAYAERRAKGLAATAWWSRGRSDDRVRVLPDTCMDVLWRHGRVVVAGADTRAHVFGQDPGEVVVGLRFDPGVLPAALDIPADELTDARIELDALRPGLGAELGERMADATDDPSALVGVLERLTVDRLITALPESVDVEMVRRLRTGSPGRLVAAELGFSERQLRRRCRASVGYSPAMLRRISRLDAALAAARSGVGRAQLAATHGYSDQAHLCRDVRELTGTSLRELVGSR